MLINKNGFLDILICFLLFSTLGHLFRSWYRGNVLLRNETFIFCRIIILKQESCCTQHWERVQGSKVYISDASAQVVKTAFPTIDITLCDEQLLLCPDLQVITWNFMIFLPYNLMPLIYLFPQIFPKN